VLCITHTSACETSRYLPCTPLSKGVLWSSFKDCPFAEPTSYYGGSVTLRLSTCRRSRVCTYETLSACRSPSVPSQAHCPSLAEESVPPSAITLVYFRIQRSRMRIPASPPQTWCGGCGCHRAELRFDSPSLTMRTGLAGRSRTCLPRTPALSACSCSLWLSPPG